MTAPGWYNADGDPPGTSRYWDGEQWVGEPVHNQTGQGGAIGAPGAPGAHGELPSGGARIGARLIDIIILIVFAVVLTALGLFGDSDDIVVDTDDGFQFSFDQTFTSPLQLLIWGVFVWAWFALWTHLKGGSPGKLALGMRVADIESGATPIPLQQSILRTATSGLSLLGILGSALGAVGSLVGLLVGIVSLVFLFSDDRHRTVMDQVAKTIVVKA